MYNTLSISKLLTEEQSLPQGESLIQQVEAETKVKEAHQDAPINFNIYYPILSGTMSRLDERIQSFFDVIKKKDQENYLEGHDRRKMHEQHRNQYLDYMRKLSSVLCEEVFEKDHFIKIAALLEAPQEKYFDYFSKDDDMLSCIDAISKCLYALANAYSDKSKILESIFTVAHYYFKDNNRNKLVNGDPSMFSHISGWSFIIHPQSFLGSVIDIFSQEIPPGSASKLLFIKRYLFEGLLEPSDPILQQVSLCHVLLLKDSFLAMIFNKFKSMIDQLTESYKSDLIKALKRSLRAYGCHLTEDCIEKLRLACEMDSSLGRSIKSDFNKISILLNKPTKAYPKTIYSEITHQHVKKDKVGPQYESSSKEERDRADSILNNSL